MEDYIAPLQKKYAETQAVADMGERLFALRALEREIDDKRHLADVRHREFIGGRQAGLVIPGTIGGGIVAMATTGSLLAGSFFVGPAMLAACIVGLLGGAISGGGASLLIWRKEIKRHDSEIKELANLSSEVRKEYSLIMTEGDLKELAASARYHDLYRDFEPLRKRFEEAAKRGGAKEQETAPVRPVKAPPPKKYPPKPFEI